MTPQQYNEKLKHYAGAKRITTGIIHQLIDGELTRFYVGKLRGMIVSLDDNYRHETKEEAYKCAWNFRESCRKELESTTRGQRQ